MSEMNFDRVFSTDIKQWVNEFKKQRYVEKNVILNRGNKEVQMVSSSNLSYHYSMLQIFTILMRENKKRKAPPMENTIQGYS